MAKTERRVSVDTCVFVNVLTRGAGDDPRQLPASAALLSAAERGEFPVFISAITIAEVFGAPKVRGDDLVRRLRSANVRAARAWLAEGRFRVVEIDTTLARAAAELAVQHQLKGADAVVLASALRARSEALYTWDRGLLKIGDRIEGVTVATPEHAPTNHDLFSASDLPA